MERYRFALPEEFHPHLPPLIPSPRHFDGDGDWRKNVVGRKLSADLGHSGKKAAADAVFHIEAGELRMNGRAFEATNVLGWQQSSWNQASQDSKTKKPRSGNTCSEQPGEAVRRILAELGDGEWADPEQLTEAFQVFHGKKGCAHAVCEAGWMWGLLAKRRADGKIWYRPAPKSPHVAPPDYLMTHQDGCVSVDLRAVPCDALEQIVAISDQRPSGKAALLATPNSIKLGRADDQLLASEPVAWLIAETPPFADAFVKLSDRRGKTVLHENVAIARVSDLSLKVAIENALGSNLVSLKNDFVAFPVGLLDEVQRVVKKSGHVVKEITAT